MEVPPDLIKTLWYDDEHPAPHSGEFLCLEQVASSETFVNIGTPLSEVRFLGGLVRGIYLEDLKRLVRESVVKVLESPQIVNKVRASIDAQKGKTV